MTTRVRLKESNFEPTWEGAIEGFVINTINRSYWRIYNVMEYEDVLQEAKMLFVELSLRYEGVVDTPQWFMSLFKRSFMNRIHNFSMTATKYQTFTTFTDVISSMENPPAQFEEMFECCLMQGGEFERLLEDSPTYVREVFSLVLRVPGDTLQSIESSWRSKGKRKTFGNNFLCEMLGYDPLRVNLLVAVKDYFETGKVVWLR